jgi:FkbM family methyltransferase
VLNTAQKIALARIASRFVMLCRKVFGKPPEAEVVRGGIRWQLDLREGIDLSIYLLGSFEPGTVKAYRNIVKPGQVVLDIGANIGAHTLPLAALAGKNGRVIAFEPTAFAAQKLTANVALNPELAPRIVLHQVMLVADTDEPLQPALFSSWPLVEAGGTVHEKHKGRLMDTSGARAATLDQMIKELGLTKVDFVKIDVDGHELAVLRGARETLKRFRPAIAIELAPYIHAEHGYSFEELVLLLTNAGYIFRELSGSGPLPTAPEMLRAMVPDGASINVLAVSL